MRAFTTVLLAAFGVLTSCSDDGDNDDSCPCDGNTDNDTDGQPPPEEGDFSAAAPFVLSTVPASGELVDAATSEIRATFSRRMMDGAWSWVTINREGVTEIEDPTNPRYIDAHTAAIDVVLEPSTTYGVWLNSDTFENFQSVDGVSAVPFALIFQTAN